MSDCCNEKSINCNITANDLLPQIDQAFPKGRLWQCDGQDVFKGYKEAMSCLLACVENYRCCRVNEVFACGDNPNIPLLSDELGYPHECVGYPTKEQLCEWSQHLKSDIPKGTIQDIQRRIEILNITDINVSVETIYCENYACGIVGLTYNRTQVNVEWSGEYVELQVGCCEPEACTPICRVPDNITCLMEKIIPMGWCINYIKV